MNVQVAMIWCETEHSAIMTTVVSQRKQLLNYIGSFKKLLERNCTSKNSLPTNVIAFWKASSSLPGDWSKSVQSGFNLPTLDDRPVLFTYLGGWSVSNWLIPLSMASTACKGKDRTTRNYTETSTTLLSEKNKICYKRSK